MVDKSRRPILNEICGYDYGIALQLSSMHDDNVSVEVLAARSCGVEPELFGLIPFSTEIIGEDRFKNYKCVDIWGSTKMLRMLKEGMFPENVRYFYDEQGFDQSFYSTYLREFLLNGEAETALLIDVMEKTFSVPKFIKPCNDLKTFPGMIVEAGVSLYDALANTQVDHSLDMADSVLISDVVDGIEIEFRLFIIRGRIVAHSVYREKGRLVSRKLTSDELNECMEFFELVYSLYRPGVDAYVVDFARVDGALKVVEYNCINCSGRYAADSSKIWYELSQI